MFIRRFYVDDKNRSFFDESFRATESSTGCRRHFYTTRVYRVPLSSFQKLDLGICVSLGRAWQRSTVYLSLSPSVSKFLILSFFYIFKFFK